MKIINPIDSDISIQYKGETFSVEAKGSVEVPEEVGNHWLSIHGFLSTENKVEKVAPVKAKKEEKEESDK